MGIQTNKQVSPDQREHAASAAGVRGESELRGAARHPLGHIEPGLVPGGTEAEQTGSDRGKKGEERGFQNLTPQIRNPGGNK